MKLIRNPAEYAKFVEKDMLNADWSHGEKPNTKHNINWAYENWGGPKKFPCVCAYTVERKDGEMWDYDDHTVVIYYRKDLLKMLKAAEKEENKLKMLLNELPS